MKQYIIFLITLFLLAACGSNNTDQGLLDTTNGNVHATHNAQQESEQRPSFKSIAEIDDSYSTWVDVKGDTASLALRFWDRYKDTLLMSYSPECILMFPYTLDGNKMVVFWDDYIDTKYQFDIVKAIDKADKKLIGKPFMTLALINDSTLEATYIMTDLIKQINASSKERTFFPKRFTIAPKDFQ